MKFSNPNTNSLPPTSEGSHIDLSDSSFSIAREDFKPQREQAHHKSPAAADNDKGRFPYNGINYWSRSEAACATLLRETLGFNIIEGKSFQVPIGLDRYGHMKRADYLLTPEHLQQNLVRNLPAAGVIIEYHPPRLWTNGGKHGDFLNWQEYLDYTRTLRTLDREAREEFKEQTRVRLLQNYYNRRREALDQNPLLREKELIVVSTPQEFYAEVLLRFAKNQPSEKKSLHRFHQVASSIEEEKPYKEGPYDREHRSNGGRRLRHKH